LSKVIDPQMAPAEALREFIAEHPVRPATRWSIDESSGTLLGHVYGPLAGGVAAVDWYAEVLGAQAAPSHVYEYGGQQLQVVRLSAVWRDVPVLVDVSVPVVLEPTQVRMADGTVLVPAVAA